jgi:hypothetical protein
MGDTIDEERMAGFHLVSEALRGAVQDYVAFSMEPAGTVPVNLAISIGDPETSGKVWAAQITFEDRRERVKTKQREQYGDRGTVKFSLPADVVEDVDRWAREDGVSRAELLRKVVMEFQDERRRDEQA